MFVPADASNIVPGVGLVTGLALLDGCMCVPATRLETMLKWHMKWLAVA